MEQKHASRKDGFTLAEVLITLGIIGVIAAITIPAVISSSSQEQYVTGVKKAYNTLKAIEREVKLEYGDPSNWAVGSNADRKVVFDTYFRPYMDILKDCGLTGKGCFGDESKYALLDGSSYVIPNDSYYKVVTSDGMTFAFIFPATDPNVAVDINGLKGPNKRGRDIFSFYFRPADGGFKPYGYDQTSEKVNENCGPGGTGVYCTAKVLSEGAMNY